MIDESGQVTLIRWIYDLSFWGFHQISTRGIAVLFYSSFSLFTVCWKYLSDILHDKLPSIYFLSGKQPPSFSWCRLGINTGILVFLEFSILTKISTIARIIIALCWHQSIEASFSAIVRNIVVFIRGLFIWFRSTIARLYFIAFWNFSFTLKVYVFTNQSKEFQTFPQIFQASWIIFEHGNNIVLLILFSFSRLLLSRCLRNHRVLFSLDFSLLHF